MRCLIAKLFAVSKHNNHAMLIIVHAIITSKHVLLSIAVGFSIYIFIYYNNNILLYTLYII